MQIMLFRNIRIMVKNMQNVPQKLGSLAERLEICRDQDNNPDSAAYKRKLEELVDEEDLIMEDYIPMKQPRLGGVQTLSPEAL